MHPDQIQRAAHGLVHRGWDLLQLGPVEAGAFRLLTDTANAFFQAPDDVRRRSVWPGHGMWAGYQPMPDGDPDLIDHVDRFEAPSAALHSPDDRWPWLSAEARALRQAYGPVSAFASDLVRNCVGQVAVIQGHDPDAAQRLWCHDDASTLVVNFYREQPAPSPSPTVQMKPHADFGGLTVIHVGAGLESLQFQCDDDWLPAAAADDDQPNVVLVLIGQLFAHWLGSQAPIHRVAHAPQQQRLSTVYFHQPHLATVIDGTDGTTIVAGEHIAAMQDHYNHLGMPAA